MLFIFTYCRCKWSIESQGFFRHAADSGAKSHGVHPNRSEFPMVWRRSQGTNGTKTWRDKKR